MDKKLFEKRLRQLIAIDKNAADIYTDLAKKAVDSKIKETLLALAIDENRHCNAEAEILSLISK